MSDQLEILEQNGIDKAEVRFQRAVDYAKTLEIVQRVIAGVEKVILSSIPQKYAVDPALNVARNLKQAIKEKETERIAEAEDHLSSELYMWHLSLTTRDQKIQPYHFAALLRRHLHSPRSAVVSSLNSLLPQFATQRVSAKQV